LIDWIKEILGYSQDTPLIFTALPFWVFFGVVLVVYSFIYKQRSLRNAFLFIASLFFYYKTSGFFFSILLFSTLTDYLIGFKIHEASDQTKKKLWLVASIVVNLGVLVFFKYAYFFADVANDVFGTHFVPTNVFASWWNGLSGSTFRVDKILLPVGISFYTFQTMSYSIDLFRGKLKPVKSLLDFGFYVSFFPQLVAGPIVRAADFIPQLYQEYKLTKAQFGIAMFWIVNGLLKKMLLADYLAVNFIDRVFDDPSRFTGFDNIMALYGYSLQVYADFSGYTDIAIGIALLLGFVLPKNFDSPYKADSCGNFWRRWHISLSSWLKDYLYIPLGGNRGGTIGTWVALTCIVLVVAGIASNVWIVVGYVGISIFVVALARAIPSFKSWITTNINIMLTMLIGGLWHGASWNFAIWGALNGLGIVFYKLWRKISPWEVKNRWYKRAWAIFLTFNFISFTRIWFRSGSHNTWDNLNDTHDILAELFTANTMLLNIGDGLKQVFFKFNFAEVANFCSGYAKVFGVMVIGFIIHWLPESWKIWYRTKFIELPMVAKVIVCFLVVVILYQIVSADMQPFIYFQF
jgi:alginate O-acetyltransferase complex protein AlgI